MRLIDADDALKRIDGLLRSPFANDKFITPQYIAVRDAIHLVKELCIGKSLTVDAVPVVHGRVLDNENPICGLCSECGESVNRKWHLCPSCGALMDLPEEEEEQNDG